MATSTLKAAPSAFDANVYATVAEADQYFNDRLAATDWTGASDDDKKKALLEATRRIDRFRFHHEKYRPSGPEQPLEFPRSNSRSVGGSVGSVAANGDDFNVVDANLAGKEYYPDDYFNGWGIEFTGGTYEGKVVLITDFVASTGTLAIETPGGSPSEGDTFILVEKVPTTIKWAVFEIATWLLAGAEEEGDPDLDVKQHRIGNFSETFKDGTGSEVRMPRKAYAYLQKFISRIGTFA